MLVQVGLEGEGLAAARADVGLRVRVRLDVGAQVRLVREGLVADRTLERLLACLEKKFVSFVSFRLFLGLRMFTCMQRYFFDKFIFVM